MGTDPAGTIKMAIVLLKEKVEFKARGVSTVAADPLSIKCLQITKKSAKFYLF